MSQRATTLSIVFGTIGTILLLNIIVLQLITSSFNDAHRTNVIEKLEDDANSVLTFFIYRGNFPQLSSALERYLKHKELECYSLKDLSGSVILEKKYNITCTNDHIILKNHTGQEKYKLEFSISEITLVKILKKHPLYFSIYFLFQVNTYIFGFYAFFSINRKKQQVENKDNLLKLAKKYEDKISLITKQVVHDIRSPLAALRSLQELIKDDQDKTFIKIFGSSLQRINDILNNLLTVYKNDEENINSKEIIHLYDILDSIISEKRVEYRKKTNSEITLIPSLKSYFCFSSVDQAQLKRVISNIINNALEASRYKSKVEIHFYTDSQDHSNFISIIDDGPGIAPELQSQIFERGYTQNKKDGQGLGLSYAKEVIQNHGGEVTVRSSIGNGAEFIIKLPKANPPSWFATKIKFDNSKTYILIDDDHSLIKSFKEKYSKIVNIRYYTSLIEVSKKEDMNDNNLFFFIDYDLKETKTGLQYITENHLERKSYLVTSNYNDLDLQNKCMNQGIKIIPKTMIDFAPTKKGQ